MHIYEHCPHISSALQAGLTHHGCPVVCKPNRQAFEIALKLAGSPEPAATLWVDDSARNITTGHRMGLYSVLVGRTGGCEQPGELSERSGQAQCAGN